MTHERDADHGSSTMRLLDREPPAGYGASWVAQLAQPRPQQLPPAAESVVVFRIGAEWLALATRVVAEVAQPRVIRSLPHRQAGLLGLANVRGELLVCVSVADTLGVQPLAATPRRRAGHGRLMVVQDEAGRIVFPVDEVHGIERIDSRRLRDVPATLANAPSAFIAATVSWEGKTIGYLDAELLLAALARVLR